MASESHPPAHARKSRGSFPPTPRRATRGSGNEPVNPLNFGADAGSKEIYTLACLSSYQPAKRSPDIPPAALSSRDQLHSGSSSRNILKM